MPLTATSFILIFLIVWWVVFFMVLPFKVEPETQPRIGHDRGAPRKAHIPKKLAVTTIVALFASLLILLAMQGH